MNIKSILGIFYLTLLSTAASAVVINFDQFPGMDFLGGAVPISSQLSVQLQPTTGAVFSSVDGAPYVGVVDLETGSPSAHAPSPPNGIGGVGPRGNINYSRPIQISFFDPTMATTKAVTNFVSITGDLRPAAGDIILKAFDINGALIVFDQQPDIPGGRVVSVTAAGIHSVTVESTSGSVAFDNLTFNNVSAVPVPAAVWLFGSGLIGLVGVARRKKA